MRTILAALAALLLSFPGAPLSHAWAATLEGVTFPDTYPAGGQTLRLNGLALRTVTVLRVRAYVAGLYLAQPNGDANAILSSPTPKVVLMQYLHDADKARVEAEFREGEQHNCGNGECPKQDETDFERLVAAAPAVKVGDTYTFLITPQNLTFLFNNKPLGTYAPDLGRLILAGFIGANPPAAEVKAGLLGAHR